MILTEVRNSPLGKNEKMRKVLSYDISEIEPYINWLYFFHAWGLSGKSSEEKCKMKQEALSLLDSWKGVFYTHSIFCLLEANGCDDDIWVYTENGDGTSKAVRIPMLRQQRVLAEGMPHLCLSDFLRPKSQGVRDKLGLFCCTVDGEAVMQSRTDEYQSMLAQTLCDRLAEATAERMHEDVRRRYWGYAPDERLTIEQSHREEYQGIRPAVGYPSMPDASLNFILDQLLDMKEVGIRLTETGMMVPHASVSGLMFAHPKSHYFDVGAIGEDQLRDYAQRRGIPVELMRRFIQSYLMKK